jgi:hypothetical protein
MPNCGPSAGIASRPSGHSKSTGPLNFVDLAGLNFFEAAAGLDW